MLNNECQKVLLFSILYLLINDSRGKEVMMNDRVNAASLLKSI